MIPRGRLLRIKRVNRHQRRLSRSEADAERFRRDPSTLIGRYGGGSLPDVGLYCLNTARALLGEEPIEVFARIQSPEDDPRFKEVEATVSFILRFPSGVVANCVSTYSLHEQRNFRVLGSEASAEIANAFGYEGQKLYISRRDAQAEARIELNLGVKNQFSLEWITWHCASATMLSPARPARKAYKTRC